MLIGNEPFDMVSAVRQVAQCCTVQAALFFKVQLQLITAIHFTKTHNP